MGGFVAAIGFLVLAPLVRIQLTALEDGGRGYRTALDNPDVGAALWTTAGLALGSVVLALVLGTAMAWLSTRLSPRLRWLGLLPVLPIMTPAVALCIGWAFLLSPEAGYVNLALRATPLFSAGTGPVDVYSPTWIVIVVGLSLASFVYLFVRSGLRNVNAELTEAAEVCGSSPTGAFFRIVLPLLRPVLVYGGTTVLLLALGQVTAPLVLGRRQGVDVLTTVMVRYTSQSPPDFGTAAAMGSPLVLLGLAVVVMQRVLLGNHARFVTHGGKAFRFSGRSSRLAAACLGGYGLVAVVLPMAALALVAVSPFWSPNVDVSALTFDHFRDVFRRTEVVNALRTSVTLSALAVAASLPIGFLAATIVYRSRYRRLAGALDFLVNMPLGIPAVVFGAGFLFTYSRPPVVLYGTRWVILLVYVTLMLPFTTRFQLAALLSLGRTYEEASSVSGAGLLRTKAEILLPMMRPALVGATTIMLVLLSHEFSASLLVRSVRTQVMGTQLFDYWVNGSYPLVAAFALVMCAVTTLGVVVALLAGGRDGLERL